MVIFLLYKDSGNGRLTMAIDHSCLGDCYISENVKDDFAMHATENTTIAHLELHKTNNVMLRGFI